MAIGPWREVAPSAWKRLASLGALLVLIALAAFFGLWRWADSSDVRGASVPDGWQLVTFGQVEFAVPGEMRVQNVTGADAGSWTCAPPGNVFLGRADDDGATACPADPHATYVGVQSASDTAGYGSHSIDFDVGGLDGEALIEADRISGLYQAHATFRDVNIVVTVVDRDDPRLPERILRTFGLRSTSD